MRSVRGATATWTALVTRLAPGGRASWPGTRASRAPSLLLGARASVAPDADLLATARSQSHGASRRAGMQARSGIEPAPAWQAPRGELRYAQFNITGDCHQVPQSRARRAWCGTAALRFAPFGFMAIPVMSCAPRRLRARSGLTRCRPHRALNT